MIILSKMGAAAKLANLPTELSIAPNSDAIEINNKYGSVIRDISIAKSSAS